MLPCHPEPFGVTSLISRNVITRQRRLRQTTDQEPARLDEIAQVSFMLATDEPCRRSLLAESLRQRQAPHHVPVADTRRRIGTEDYRQCMRHGVNPTQFRRLNPAWHTGPSSSSSTDRPVSHSRI